MGKSVAALKLLSSVATTLQLTSDGSSEKSHTAFDPGCDMRIEFNDELKVGLNGTSENQTQTMGLQTLVSAGVFTYTRLEQNKETRVWENAKTEKVRSQRVGRRFPGSNTSHPRPSGR